MSNMPLSALHQRHLHQATSLWEQAAQSLPESDRALINFNYPNKAQVLQDILAIAEEKKEICLQKRWRYRKGKNEVIIRDKLDKITTWINRFKDVGTTAVQYDPVHAALPWAGVLLVLQIATNDSQTFGAMVDGIETISNLLPRYAIIEAVYFCKHTLPSSQGQLQLALIKLYTSILRYLIRSRQYFSRSTATRVISSTLSTPESQVQRYLDIVSKKAADVDSSLLLVQAELNQSIDGRVAELLKCLSDLQKPIIRSSAQIFELHNHFTKEQRRSILNWLSKVRAGQHHCTEGEDYLPGSGFWFLRTAKFADWRASSSSAILWLHGIPGCGKSKLIYRTIQMLLDQSAACPNPAPLAYFYCSRNPAEPERSNPTEVMRSLLKQLALSGGGKLKDPVLREFRDREIQAEFDGSEIAVLSLNEAEKLILELLEREPATIVIDAMDECDLATRHNLLSALENILQESASVVKILVASRDDGDIDYRFSGVPNVYVRADDNGADIEMYIDHSLSRVLKSGRLLNGKLSDEIQAEVSCTLKNKAQGMFRWVTMQIDNICDSRRIKIESDVRDELGQLPRTLWESYDRNYKRVLGLARPSRNLAERIFKWILSAQKLMTVGHLIAAVTFSSENHVLTMQCVLDICCNMIVVDKNGHFRFAHLSVREYLESLDAYSTTKCHAFVLQRCLESYINTAADDWILHSSYDLEIRPYAMVYWPFHSQKAQDGLLKRTPTILMNEFIFGDDDFRRWNTTASVAFSDWLNDIWNTTQYSAEVDVERVMLQKLESVAAPFPTPLFFACTFDSIGTLEAMKTAGWNHWTLFNNLGDTSIKLTIRWGNSSAFHWLLDNTVVTMDGMTAALSVAIDMDNIEFARTLIARGANGFADSEGKKTPLEKVTKKGHISLVRAILEMGEHFEPCEFACSMFSAYYKSPGKCFPIYWKTCVSLSAVEYFRVLVIIQEISHMDELPLGHLDAAERLFQLLLSYSKSSASPGIKKIYDLSEKFPARFQSIFIFLDGNVAFRMLWKEHTVTYLDCSMADISEKHIVEEKEFLAIVLAVGALPNIKFDQKHLLPWNADPQTSMSAMLLLALRYGHESILDRDVRQAMLERGVDLNFSDDKGRTAMMFATKPKDPAVLKFLLENGADVRAVDKKGQSTLAHALKNDNVRAVAVLIRSGIDINTPVWENMTPLHVAADDDAHNLLLLLRNSGARRPGFVLQKYGFSIPFLAWELCRLCKAIMLGHTSEQDRLSGIGNIFDGLASKSIADYYSMSKDTEDAEIVDAIVEGSASVTEKITREPEEQSSWSCLEYIVPNLRSWEDGLTPLQAAIALKNEDAVEKLLEIPVDVNDVDDQGFTALHYCIALQDTRYDILNVLLDHSADPSIQDRNGRTPLHLAAHQAFWRLGHCIEKLLDVMDPAGINLPDVNGNTVMHIAIMTCNEMLVERLLDASADLNVKNHQGKTAVQLARSLGLMVSYFNDDVFGDANELLFEEGRIGPIHADAHLEAPELALGWSDGSGHSDDKGGNTGSSDGQDGDSIQESKMTTARDLIVRGEPGSCSSKPLDPVDDDLPTTEMDLFSSHGVDHWTFLSGTATVPLRPVDAIFR